jgi:hypothetical protein
MPLYEVMLFGEGAPELRLTDRALAVGDVVEIAQRFWRVERTTDPSREDAERRFLLVLEDAGASPAEAGRARNRARDVNLILAGPDTSLAGP